MIRCLIKCLTLVLYIWFNAFQITYAQDYQTRKKVLINQQKELKKDIESLTDAIANTEKELDKTENNYEENFKKYGILKNKIVLQEQKLGTLEKEINIIENQLNITEKQIDKLEKQESKIKESIKNSFIHIYKYNRISPLTLLLASGSSSQMMRKIYYLERYTDYRNNKIIEIKKIKQQTEQEVKSYNQTKALRKIAYGEEKNTKRKLDIDHKNLKNVISTLNTDKTRLSQKLTKEMEQRNNLEEILSKVSLEEENIRRMEQRKALYDTKTTPSKTSSITPKSSLSENELKTLSKKFQNNKGKLPWPVKKGYISRSFGKNHNELYKTSTYNIGIDIITPSQSDVMAIHDGVISTVQLIPGYGNIILINHGDYKSLYGNLTAIRVSKNDVVKAGQIIGLSGNKSSPRGAVLFFMIRKNQSNLNPKTWLKTK